MRTQNSIRNLIVAIIGQVLGVAISFFSRIVFIKFLNAEYLGLDGLFTNILTILSLVELGVGNALVFNLYRPLAEENISKIKSLMNLYKKVYRIIGIIIIILGLIMLPIYRHLIDEVPDIANLDIIFLLYVLNTAISYFFSYKRSLIICDQKRYIATIFRYGFYFLLNVVQIIVLYITKNYILFLVSQVIFTFLENLFISLKADKMYPYLKEKDIEPLPKEETTKIKKNVYAMMFHKVGGAVVNSTDNILISKFVGLAEVGIYSNYYLVTNALVTITNQVFDAVIASVGNLGTTKDKKKIKDIFNDIFLLNFWVFGLISTTLAVIFNHFIQVWVGTEYLFPMPLVYVIVISFYLRGMRKSCLTFRDALGIFWYDRYKPIIESIINLGVSILLATKLGVLGIFIGTIVSTLTTSFWVEPYILYKYGFQEKVGKYFKRYFIYTLIGIIAFFVMNFACSFINTINIWTFILKGIICVIIFSMVFVLFFLRTKEFKYYLGLIKSLWEKIREKIKS